MDKKENIDKIKKDLFQAGIKPNKRIGQNFLISDKVLEKIISNSDLKNTDTVLEVGPGLGVLTNELAKKVKLVVGVEKDRKMVEYLRKKYKGTNVKIVCSDILDFDLSTMEDKYKIISNLPYQISSVFVNKVITSSNKPQMMMLMLQKEVGLRFNAEAGNADRGILTVFLKLVADTEIIEYVQKHNFYPIPEVDSVVVKFNFDKNKKYKKLLDDKGFCRLIKIGFSQKRRQIHHPLSAGLRIDKNKIKSILKSLDIDPSLRAEDLRISDWVKLYEKIKARM